MRHSAAAVNAPYHRIATLLALGATTALGLACEGEGFVKLGPPVLLVNVDQVAFGQVPVGFLITKRVTLANGGDQALELSRIATEGDAVFEVSQGATVVESGKEVEIIVTFAPDALRTFAGSLVVESNASNARMKAVPLSGVGVSVTSCGDCSSPPAAACLSADERITYAATGTCVMDECEYTSSVERCAQGCEATTAQCRGVTPDAGVSPDAAPVDTGVGADGGVAPDAEAPDAGFVDTGVVEDSGVTPDGGTLDPCAGDAGVADSGLGAPGAAWSAPGEHTFTVPSGVSELLVRAWGGGGQGGNQNGATGGGGAFVQARLPVTPGEALAVWVAEGGAGAGALGFGAGASYVRRGAAELVVAAGGGGGGSDGNSGNSMAGGAGGAGGPVGESGQNGLGMIAPYCTLVTGGTGGTGSAGGLGGTSQGSSPNKCDGQPGARNVGGRASGTNGTCQTTPGANDWRAGGGQANGGGGGGGAGYYGGGGSGFIWTYCGGGGGGGASFVDPGAAQVVHEGGAGRVQGRAPESWGAGRGGLRCQGARGSATCQCNEGASGRVELYF